VAILFWLNAFQLLFSAVITGWDGRFPVPTAAARALAPA
jgi:hypothetical protein